MNPTRIAAASAFAAAALSAGTASAQSILLPGTPEKGITFEAAHANFREDAASTASAVFFLSGRLPLGERLRLIADVPVAHGSFAGELGELFDGESTVLGNPKLGLELAALPSLVVEGSVRLPLGTASETSVGDVIGILSDPQRAEAFAMDVVPATAAFTYQVPVAGALGLRARAGATHLFYTGDEADVENTTLLDYGLFGTYPAGPARLGLGVSGRYNASGDEGDFGDRSLHFAGATADFQVAGVRPGVSLQVPLDSEHREVVGPSFGLYLQVPLR